MSEASRKAGEEKVPAKDEATEGARPSAGHDLWGGRFSAKPSQVMERINASIDADRRFALEDIAGSRAHCRMLVTQGIIPESDGARILEGLETVEAEIREGRMRFDPALEDIHMHVEARLHELIGPAAGRLHTARSRNDQVATDFRLWCRRALLKIEGDIADLQRALLTRAEEHAETLMPGFTHLQVAQPVTFGHHLMAYFEMLARDRGRIADARRRLNESPLGAAALAGTAFPIDREATARALGFARPMANSLDAVSARDFALESVAALDILALHLSRLAEELVIWSSPAFGFVRIDDTFSTGSSIMPQKRNPDAAELIRAKPGTTLGSYARLHTMLKGLPLAYAKDLQEDKPPVFEAVDAVRLGLAAMTGMIAGLTANEERMAEMAGSGFSTATDLADWLVRQLAMPFREAHHVVGRLVRHAEESGRRLDELTLDEIRAQVPEADESVFAVLSARASAESRTSFGGTAPAQVRERLAAAAERLAGLDRALKEEIAADPIGLETPP